MMMMIMMYHFKMTEKLNFKAICSLTTRVMGLEEGSLSSKSRERRLQSARSAAGYIALTEEDISRNVIADILDRDRTATYHYERTHKKNFNRCRVYRDIFTKIYKEYKNIDGEKEIFINKRQMKHIFYWLFCTRLYKFPEQIVSTVSQDKSVLSIFLFTMD